MALTRRTLSAMGIEGDKIDEIISLHTETVDALKAQRDEYKADAEKLPNVQKELDDLKEAAEKNPDDAYKAKYDELKQEYDNYKTAQAEKEAKAQKESAYRALLKEAGVSEKRIDSIIKVTDTSGYEIADGKIKNSESVVENIKSEWADFIQTQSTQGASTSTPPASTGTSKPESRARMLAQKYHADLYGKKGD